MVARQHPGGRPRHGVVGLRLSGAGGIAPGGFIAVASVLTRSTPDWQINGVANRTTIADGNTWNHEHIALLGKCLVSNMTESHKATRAD